MSKAAAADTSAYLTQEQIDDADDRPEFDLEIPLWHGKVRLRGLTYDQLAACRQRAWDTRKKETNEDILNAWCVSLGTVVPATSFIQAKKWITERNFGSVNAILSAVLKATGLGGAAQAEAKSDSDPELTGDL